MAAQKITKRSQSLPNQTASPARIANPCGRIYKTIVITTLLLFAALLPLFPPIPSPSPFVVQAAEDENQEPMRWLPARLQDSLQPYLDAIIRHADTRLPCTTILEAKYSDGSGETNPKFIVTCESDEYGSTNLVYWKRDVDELFANVAYEAKPSVTASELNLDEVDLTYSASEQLAMVDSCKEAFNTEFADKLPRLGEPRVQKRLRANTLLAIYLDYPRIAAPESQAYTAACLIKPNQPPKLDVFSR